jgi:hypothetical protein
LLSTPKQPQDSNLLLKNKYWEMTMNASTTRYVIGITTFLFMPNKIVNPSIASNITNMKTLTNAFDDERVNPNRLKARVFTVETIWPGPRSFNIADKIRAMPKRQ